MIIWRCKSIWMLETVLAPLKISNQTHGHLRHMIILEGLPKNHVEVLGSRLKTQTAVVIVDPPLGNEIRHVDKAQFCKIKVPWVIQR